MQHDCHRGGCDTSALQPLYQDREITTQSRVIVHHQDQTNFVINTQSLHNYRHIPRAIPIHLHGSSFHVADPVGLRNQAASILRDKKQQQNEARKAILMALAMGRAEAPASLSLPNDAYAPPAPSVQQPENLTQIAANANGPAHQLLTTEEAPLQLHFPSRLPVFSQPSTSASAQSQGPSSANIPTTLYVLAGEKCRKDVLQHYCRLNGLSTGGNKPELLARLDIYYNKYEHAVFFLVDIY